MGFALFDPLHGGVVSGASVLSGGNVFGGDIYSIGLLDDSRAQYALTNATLRSGKTVVSSINWAMALLGQRFSVPYNGGLAGQRSDQWQTANSPMPGNAPDGRAYSTMNNVDALIASGVGWAFLPAGGFINDLLQNPARTASEILNGFNGAPGLYATWNKIYSAGVRPILGAERGAGSGLAPASVVNTILAVNAAMFQWCATHPGAIFLPTGSIAWTPASTTTIGFKTNYSAEANPNELHYAAANAYAEGVVLAAILDKLIPFRDTRKYSGLQTYAKTGIDYQPNPLFLTGTGGTVQTGVTGTMPANCIASRTGAATATVSVGADPNGYGNAITVAGTFSAANEEIRVRWDCGTANIAAGDKFFSECRVEVANGSSGLIAPYCWNVVDLDGSNTQTYDLAPNSVVVQGPTTAYNVDLRSDDMTILPYSSIATGLRGYASFYSSGAGSFTALVSRPGTTKRV